MKWHYLAMQHNVAIELDDTWSIRDATQFQQTRIVSFEFVSVDGTRRFARYDVGRGVWIDTTPVLVNKFLVSQIVKNVLLNSSAPARQGVQ